MFNKRSRRISVGLVIMLQAVGATNFVTRFREWH